MPEVTITGGPLGKTSISSVDQPERDDDLWGDEDGDTPDDDGTYLRVEDETIENQPKNKARVFRIRSLDQMVDETQRLSRAYAEGDLLKWVHEDEGASFKTRLLLKQLNQLTMALRAIVQERGWDE